MEIVIKTTPETKYSNEIIPNDRFAKGRREKRIPKTNEKIKISPKMVFSW